MDGCICAACQGPGKLACSGCRLVVYCSRACQVAHRSEHKQWCNSSLNNSTWKPQWALQGRRPNLSDGGYKGKKYFYGNVPARDIIHLEGNEGKSYDQDMNVLFAASGDPRNMIETIANLPQEYTKTLSLHINDVDFDIVARNIIIMLVPLVVSDPAEAADCMIHLWYSTLIRESDYFHVLAKHLGPLFKDVCAKIEKKPEGSLLGKTWKIGLHTCRVELPREKWFSLLEFLQVPQGFCADMAKLQRTDIMQAPQRRDYRESRMVLQSPEHRVAAARFREDGLLLPFGHSRAEFVVPNPTLFQTVDWPQISEWPMDDDADPFEGWSWSDTLRTDAGPASNDIYGKLFYYVRDRLHRFLARLSRQGFNFNFYNVNATQLAGVLAPVKFARVEASINDQTPNIADQCHLGTSKTIASLAHLLDDLSANKHATLITMHMNAVTDTICSLDPKDAVKHVRAEIAALAKYNYRFKPTATDIMYIMADMVTPLVRDCDGLFAKYMNDQRFDAIEKKSYMVVKGGCSIKKQNTIVDKWPYRLKLKPGQPGAQEEFNTAMVGGAMGVERYVEWKRCG